MKPLTFVDPRLFPEENLLLAMLPFPVGCSCSFFFLSAPDPVPPFCCSLSTSSSLQSSWFAATKALSALICCIACLATAILSLLSLAAFRSLACFSKFAACFCFLVSFLTRSPQPPPTLPNPQPPTHTHLFSLLGIRQKVIQQCVDQRPPRFTQVRRVEVDIFQRSKIRPAKRRL